MLISFLSTMSLWGGNYTQFAVLYSVGNTIALLSMGFLMGACVVEATGSLIVELWGMNWQAPCHYAHPRQRAYGHGLSHFYTFLVFCYFYFFFLLS